LPISHENLRDCFKENWFEIKGGRGGGKGSEPERVTKKEGGGDFQRGGENEGFSRIKNKEKKRKYHGVLTEKRLHDPNQALWVGE